MNKYKEKIKHGSLLLLITLFLASCGGAKSGPGTTAKAFDPDASNWNLMRWDDDEWE